MNRNAVANAFEIGSEREARFRTERLGGMRLGFAMAMIAAALWTPNPLPAQTDPAPSLSPDIEAVRNAPWTVHELGQGVVAKTHRFESLFGGAQRVFVVEADMNTPGVSLRFLGGRDGTRQPVSEWAASLPGTVAAINGAWANPRSGIPDQFLRIGGAHLADTHPVAQERGGIVIDAAGRVTCRPRPEGGWASLPEPNVMASEVPSLVQGRPYVWSVSEPGANDHNYYYRNRHPRSAIGVTADNRVLLVVVDGRRAPEALGASHAHMAELLLGLGAVDGTQLDGGGSSTLWGRDFGVFNTPSDGHERRIATALCIVAPPVERPYMAEWLGADAPDSMNTGDTRTATFRFRNTGTETWGEDVFLATTEPRERESPFRAPSWVHPASPCGLADPAVAPGEVGAFVFELRAPRIDDALVLHESFGLMRKGGRWFGPEGNRIAITVNPVPEGEAPREVLVEARGGGRNHGWYSETGAWADVTADCLAPGSTPGIGMRYASTYRSVAGRKIATYRPVLARAGTYEVYVAWGEGRNRRSPITYRVESAEGLRTLHLDQAAQTNRWVSLGRYRFEAGSGGGLRVSNEDIDEGGSLYTAAARFVFVE